MWWELLRYPSDDPQAQIFWRRRVSVLAVAAVVVLLMLTLLLRGGGADEVTPTSAEQVAPTAAPVAPAAVLPASPSPTASPAPPSPSPSPSDSSTTCAPGSMALRVSPDAPTYPAGSNPVLTLSVVDVGTKPCTVDLGTKSTGLTVLSAGKPVWTSRSCTEGVAQPTQLTPAAAQQVQLTWDRTRNVQKCAAPEALPAGQYELVAHVGNTAAYGGSFELR